MLTSQYLPRVGGFDREMDGSGSGCRAADSAAGMKLLKFKPNNFMFRGSDLFRASEPGRRSRLFTNYQNILIWCALHTRPGPQTRITLTVSLMITAMGPKTGRQR